jgi:hypothetical protein
MRVRGARTTVSGSTKVGPESPLHALPVIARMTSARVLVTGPCATATAALIQAAADGAVIATDMVADVPEARPSTIGAHTAPVLGVGSFAADGRGCCCSARRAADRGWAISSALRNEVDAVIFVVDADAVHTHSEARCDAAVVRARVLACRWWWPSTAATTRARPARSPAPSEPVSARTVVGCQLIDPRSGRDVVIEALDALLGSLDLDASDRQVA